MQPETMRQGLTHAEPCKRPSPIHFEMAYQARVAIDRIKFAIRHVELCVPSSPQVREAGLQLLDALDRLQAVEQRFQDRARVRAHVSDAKQSREGGNGLPGRNVSRS
jgi:hypothetical protein